MKDHVVFSAALLSGQVVKAVCIEWLGRLALVQVLDGEQDILGLLGYHSRQHLLTQAHQHRRPVVRA